MWPHLEFTVTNLGSALNVLAAMITPALLLSACGTFILSTSNRLARIVDRMRSLSQQLDELMQTGVDVALRQERIVRHRAEIKLQGHRLGLIQRALTLLYVAAVNFVCTSVAIGVTSTISLVWVYWMPVVFGIAGACCMLVAAIMLALEARRAVHDMYEETEFHRSIARHYANQSETSAEKS
ncbi:MAG TPA: DUF2721 domain-containing protein [Paludibaculum sp.]|jgi:hypothetical protein